MLASQLLDYCLMIDRQVWVEQHALRQFTAMKDDWGKKLDDKKVRSIVDCYVLITILVSSNITSQLAICVCSSSTQRRIWVIQTVIIFGLKKNVGYIDCYPLRLKEECGLYRLSSSSAQ